MKSKLKLISLFVVFLLANFLFSSCVGLEELIQTRALNLTDKESSTLFNYTDYPVILYEKDHTNAEAMPYSSKMKIAPGEYIIEGSNLQVIDDHGRDAGYYSCSTKFTAMVGKAYYLKINFIRYVSGTTGGLSYNYNVTCSVYEKE